MKISTRSLLNRREFLAQSTSCAAHIALVAAVTPPALLDRWTGAPSSRTVAQEAFGRLEAVAPGVWALISNPMSGDRTTLANGGIIAGRDGVLAIEGFMMPAGARWLATKARELAGRWPTQIVLSHYHADHVNGVAGYAEESSAPKLRSTEATRSQAIEKNQPADESRSTALRRAEVLDVRDATTIDLGGRRVRLVPRSGHTASDVTIELDDPAVVFCGDLVWNGMFPNYVDAKPSELGRTVRALERSAQVTYVPGHGPLAKKADFDRYVAMLDEVEQAARRLHAQGVPANTAGAQYSLPASLGEWTLFNRVFFERAFTAWYRELGG
jgi:glyoxylase-like metal-dependent hydrolase (beta-lactamase superfamily II)